MTTKDIKSLHRKYAPSESVYKLVFDHCRIVADIALWCAANAAKPKTDVKLLETAALLHDVGAYTFFDESGKVINQRMYRQHAILGAKILADEGMDIRITKAVETHVLLGLTQKEILENKLPLPARDYVPETIEGELLCYADRFHTKLPAFSSFDSLMSNLKSKFPLQAEKFALAAKRFGIPDVNALSVKWGHSVSRNPVVDAASQPVRYH